MPSFVATLPLLVSMLALARAGENDNNFPISSPPSLPPHGGGNFNQGPPPQIQDNGYAGITAPPGAGSPGQKPPSIFVLTQVPPSPTSTGGQPGGQGQGQGQGHGQNQAHCQEVAARITPQLTARPAYPQALKDKADRLGGIQYDTCREYKAVAASPDASKINEFNQERYTSFIVPIWAKVNELYQACGEHTKDIRAIGSDPCYKWALELCESSHASTNSEGAGGGGGGFGGLGGGSGNENNGNNKGGEAGGAKQESGGGAPSGRPQAAPSQTSVVEGGAGKSAVSHGAALVAVGFMTLLCAAVLR